MKDPSKRYFTGIPCKHGHISERWTNNGRCIQCRNNYAKANVIACRKRSVAYSRKILGCIVPYDPPGYCEICDTTDPGKRSWHLDHDHATKAFRGWLCGRCNRGLGFFKDAPMILDKAAAYLRNRKTDGG